MDSNSWTSISSTGAPTARVGSFSAWIGSKFLIVAGGDATNVNNGAAYTPPSSASANTWTAMTTTGAPSARFYHAQVWTGSQLLVWGGYDGISPFPNAGGKYDPISNSWTVTATTGAPTGRALPAFVWSGSSLLVWGGNNLGSTFYNDGGKYDPVANVWTPIDTTGAPTSRSSSSFFWTGSRQHWRYLYPAVAVKISAKSPFLWITFIS